MGKMFRIPGMRRRKGKPKNKKKQQDDEWENVNSEDVKTEVRSGKTSTRIIKNMFIVLNFDHLFFLCD